jgi:hypothetical protein
MAVNLPVQNFFNRRVEPNAWTRPSDWPVIIDSTNEVQFLMSDINNSSCTVRTQFTRTSGSQNIVIDWGDGTTTTVTSTIQTDTTKVYTPGTGTPCSRGYTTFKIRVYFTGTGVSVISACRLFGILLPGNTANLYTNVGLLEAYYGDNTQTAINTATYYQSNTTPTTSLSNFDYLEYVKLPSVVTWSNMGNLFENCTSLYVVIMPTSASSLTNVGSMVTNCPNLLSITFPSNATGITNFGSVFSSCNSLTSVTLPASLNNCTSFGNTFQQCWSLKNLTIPSINICNSFSNAFTNCFSLEWVKFISLPTFGSSTAVTFASAFLNNYNLQNVYFPATCSANANYNFTGAFSSCTNLKNIVFPSGFNPNTLSSAFSNCFSLKSVIFNSGASNLSSLATSFQNCQNLTYIKLPDSVSISGVVMSQTFTSCTALQTITIPNNYLVTTLASAFAQCNSLKTINWTPGSQNSLTSLNGTFSNCLLLSSFTLPTSMNLLNDMSFTFATCRSISTLTFPASLNAVTTVQGVFSSMSQLQSITLPTSMSACTNFGSIFTDCKTIRNITMPSTVSINTTTFINCFSGCTALRTVTLPSVNQLSLVNNIQGMFQFCSNLTTVNNLNRIGSLTATPLVLASNITFMSADLLSFAMPFTQLSLNGNGTGTISGLRAVRLLNTSAGQWTGTSPQISVNHTVMSTSALIDLFNDMAAQGTVTSKTINITGATGTGGLTTANRQIITTRGWTITG